MIRSELLRKGGMDGSTGGQIYCSMMAREMTAMISADVSTVKKANEGNGIRQGEKIDRWRLRSSLDNDSCEGRGASRR